jgi:hypothetical protein
MISDTLHDAVSDIDRYLEDGGGQAWSGSSFHGVILETRDRMERLRCLLDDDPAYNSFRECPVRA